MVAGGCKATADLAPCCMDHRYDKPMYNDCKDANESPLNTKHYLGM